MSKEIRTLEVMPEEIKVLYTKILVAQAVCDRRMDPREFSDLYLFMAQENLDISSREKVRNFMVSKAIEEKILELAEQVVSKVEPEEKDIIKFSVIKDLIRVGSIDGKISPEEVDNVDRIARALYEGDQDKADEVVKLAEEAIKYDKKLLEDKISPSEFEKGAKELAAKATSIGVPIAAVYFSGSVVGLSAAGITSGLAALGVGGLLGLSSMVTGIGAVVVLGIVTYKAAKWVMSGKEREIKAQREHMIQQVIILNQKATASLAEDMNHLAGKMEQLASMSAQNKKMLLRLKALYQDALAALKEREQNYAEVA